MSLQRARRSPWGRISLWLSGTLCWLSWLSASAASFPGFTIEPPRGEAWHLVQRNANSLVWMRRVPGDAMTFGVAVLTQSLTTAFESPAAYLAWVRRTKEHNPDPDRFDLTNSRIEPETGIATYCVRYQTEIEDRADGTGEGVTRELRVAGLACLHPAAPKRYFDIQYSSRSATGQSVAPDILEEGRAFVESMRFTEPPPDDAWALGEHAPTRLERDAT